MENYIRICVVIVLTIFPAISIAEDAASINAEENAALSIESYPENGTIYINGEFMGITPLFGLELLPDRYRIRGKFTGEPDIEVKVTLKGGSTTELELVNNDTEKKGNWISRHSFLFGSLLGVGVSLTLYGLYIWAASTMG